MTILEWLLGSMKKLADAGVDSPRRDCLVLLEDLLQKDRSWILAHAEHELGQSQIKTLDNQVNRRTRREPLAYVRRKAWFYGRSFRVNPSVMIPRPESESFIGLLKEINPKKIIDIGTGSGCLAISAKLELPESDVYAIDISTDALKIAEQNIKKYKVSIKTMEGSLLEPLKTLSFDPDVIMANLPYVPEELITSKEITYEPSLALFSRSDGLDHYRQFWQQIKVLEIKPEYILAESLQSQHKEMIELAEKSGYKPEKTDTLVQEFKLV
ncbi:MAG TPA: peptide chain release factor N(5)-glutamine methyltransferase [Patescibacteria group bacterium]|nr:peptide chain release factor N(5)-glutamine methyltransferase [Patescibacteria group bacterium]